MPQEETIRSMCPQSHRCGGCQLQNLTYPEQLAFKQRLVQRLVGPFCPVLPILGMETPYHYRNKVQAAFAADRKGRILSGVYQSGTHLVVPVDDCLLEDEAADRIIVTVRRLLPRFGLAPYDERTRRGFLRHVLVKRGFRSGEIMVVLVTATPVFPSKNAFVAELLRRRPEITTIVQNVNRAATSLVLGGQEKTLFGRGTIEEQLCGLTFRISPRSFYQINPIQTEALYGTAIDFAELTGRERVLDAYCGVGTIGLIAAAKAAEVVGVEQNRDAVRDAIANARRNGVENIRFLCADAGEYMVGLAESNEAVDVVLMDPPRAGASAVFLGSLLQLAPKRIVYVSCNPETLARDLRILTGGGYRAERCQPVDMFPHTGHVETVCLLSKLSEAKNHISVKVDMDEMDLTAAESKATYQEIQEWVQEKYGFHVSHLNIAKTKRKCGIIERKNYNLPKNEDSRSPETPKEKEEAITEAFRHFQMI